MTTQTDARPQPVQSSEQLAAAAIVIVVMSVIATVGFRTVFSTPNYLLASVAGAALGALVIVVGRRFRLLFGEIVGVGLLAPMLVGPIAVGGLDFYRGLVFGWSDILSATPPIDATAELKALPFIAAFVGASLGTELFRIRELPGIAITGPLATLTITALFSEQTRNGAVGVGLVLLVGLLVLARLHYASLSTTGVLVLGFVIALVAGLASTATLLLPYADESSRFDLRDLQEAPWDPLALPSPLTEIKAGLKSAATDESPVLRISGDEPVLRWRTASLPAYNGIYWGVSEPGQIAEFVPIDTSLPAIDGEPRVDERYSFDVDILAPIGVWVPTGGVPTNVDFRDQTDARMSLQSGTIGVPEALQPGNSYSLEVTPWVELDDAALAGVVFAADVRSTELELLPPLVRNLAADFSTGLDQLSGRRVIAIRDNLRLGSYELEHPPGHSFGQIAEFLQPVQLTSGVRDETDLRGLVAYEELYASSGALLARLSDIPTRVAVGYVIPEERWSDRSAELFASDANAWIEVFVEGQGWVPIDVTPDRQRQPEEVDEGIETEGVPVADPPKAPPEPEEDEQPEIEEPEEEEDDEIEDEDEEDPPELVGISVTRVAAIAAGSALGLCLLALAGVAGLKALRRRRRRDPSANPSRRIAGAWAELINRFDESGGELPATATPREAAEHARSIEVLADPEMASQVERLANEVSVAAFHPLPPTQESAETAWQSYDAVAAKLRKNASPAVRIIRAVNPRTLRDDDRMGAR